MGFYPCSGHGLMFKGAAEAVYPALVEGGNSERAHLRLCHDCFVAFLARAEELLVEVIAGAKGGAGDQRRCYRCDAGDTRAAVFVTAYPKGEEGRQFFAGVCAEHLDAARAAWLGADVVVE